MAVAGLGGLAAWFAGSGRLLFVAGLDRYLPPAFSRIHTRWHTPAVALLAQGGAAVLLTFLATVGTSVQNAYLFFADLTTILAFIPYLYMFASCIVLRAETARAPGAIPIPGGPAGNVLANVSGFLMTALAIVLSCVPPPEESRKILRVALLAGGAAMFIAIGFGLYALASRRERRA